MNEIDIINYYKTHTVYDTGKHFHIGYHPLVEILKRNDVYRKRGQYFSVFRQEGKIYCSMCDSYKDINLFASSIINKFNLGKINSGYCSDCTSNKFRKLHDSALFTIANYHNKSIVCWNCGLRNIRILQIAHINSVLGSLSERKDIYGYSFVMYNAIISGRRKVNDLGILCPNCNILDEYSNGYRNVISINGEIHIKAMEVICFKNGFNLQCYHCGEADNRLLTINHINGGGNDELRTIYHGDNVSFYRSIINGSRLTTDLNILCYNCQHLHKLDLLHPGVKNGTFI